MNKLEEMVKQRQAILDEQARLIAGLTDKLKAIPEMVFRDRLNFDVADVNIFAMTVHLEEGSIDKDDAVKLGKWLLAVFDTPQAKVQIPVWKYSTELEGVQWFSMDEVHWYTLDGEHRVAEMVR